MINQKIQKGIVYLLPNIRLVQQLIQPSRKNKPGCNNQIYVALTTHPSTLSGI
jgi:hypothetical protein